MFISKLNADFVRPKNIWSLYFFELKVHGIDNIKLQLNSLLPLNRNWLEYLCEGYFQNQACCSKLQG